jgi:predicted phosphodiesterase
VRYAILSDVHANLEALTAVFARIDALSIDQVVCLGDVVGYHADHDACVRLIRERCAVCIQGNHDRAAIGVTEPYDFSLVARHAALWTRRTMSAESRAFLASLPRSHATGDFVLTHAGLYPMPNDRTRIASLEGARRHLDALAFDGYPSRICFFGHTHKALAYERSRGATVTRRAEVVTVDGDAFYLVNPGTAGQPRDDDRDASFAVYDTDARAHTRTIQWEVVPFDRETTLAKARAAGALVEEASLAQSAAPRARLGRLAARVSRVARVTFTEARNAWKK